VAGWFTSTDSYTETIYSVSGPELDESGKVTKEPVGDKATVTMRALNAGDQADIQDILRMEMGDDSDRSQLALGSMRRMSVEKSLIDWSIPGPKPTPESIRQLSPEVFEQIYSYVKLGNVHPMSPPAEPEKNGTSAPAEDESSSKTRPARSSVATS